MDKHKEFFMDFVVPFIVVVFIMAGLYSWEPNKEQTTLVINCVENDILRCSSNQGCYGTLDEVYQCELDAIIEEAE